MLPVIGTLPVQSIDTPAVLRVLTPLWATKTETASSIRNRIETILDWAKVAGHRDGENPARWDGHIEQLLPAKARIAPVQHHPALAYADLPAFMGALRQHPDLAARALEFTILTAARTDEARFGRLVRDRLGDAHVDGAGGADEDEEGAPCAAVRCGHGLARYAPERRRTLGPGLPRLPPGPPARQMSLLLLVRRLGQSVITVHGFRSTFSTWAAERTDFASEVVELALAHIDGNKVARAYRRTDQFEQRVRLMQAWAPSVPAGCRRAARLSNCAAPDTKSDEEARQPRPDFLLPRRRGIDRRCLAT